MKRTGWLGLALVVLALVGGVADAANTFSDLSGSKYAHTFFQTHAAADATQDHPIFRCVTAVACRIIKVTVVPGAAVTGAATNNYSLQVTSWTDAATPVATAQGTAVNFASGVNEIAMKARVLWAPSPVFALPVGQYLSITRTLVGTGLASPNYGVIVEWDNGG